MADADGNPYVGPRPFERDDRDRFFGRDGEVRELLSLVVSERVVLLYAASGAGKTSLLHAGLVPLLEEDEGFEVLPVTRIQAGLPEETLTRARNVFTLGVVSSLEPGDSALPALETTTLVELLAARPHRYDAHGFAAPRALIVDQFEELFTAHPRYWRQRAQFVADLAAALDDDPLLRVVLSIREDHVAQLDPHVAALPRGLRARFRLERLGPEAAIEAVVNPTLPTPRRYADDVAEKLVADLLRFRADTGRGETIEIEGEFVEPVQLQVVCESLWGELPPSVTEITEEHLRRFGDVDEVLRRFYDEAVRAAAAAARVPERRLRALVERSLITAVGTRNTVYRQERTTGDISNAAIDELENRHVMRAEWRAGARWYELTHDRLIAPIQTSNRRFRERLARKRRVPAAVALAAAVLAAVILGLASMGNSGGGGTALAAGANLSLTETDADRAAHSAQVKGQVSASGLRGVPLRIVASVVDDAGKPVVAPVLQSRFVPGKDLSATSFTASMRLPRRDGDYHLVIALENPARTVLARVQSERITVGGRDVSVKVRVRFTVRVTGSGHVAFGAGGSTAQQLCPPVCTGEFPHGTRLKLVAVPARTSVFGGWSSCPGEAARTCVVRAGRVTVASARFDTVIGRTARGTPITATMIGDERARRRILVIGCLRPAACAGTAVADALAGRAGPAGAAIWIVRNLDPDGITRDKDLNHDFPCDWAPANADTARCRGRNALSTPEARAAVAFIRRLRPNLTIWYFSRATTGDKSLRPAQWVALGGDRGEREAEARYARLVGYGRPVAWVNSSTGRVTLEPPGGNYGSGTAWQRHLNPPMRAFWVELPLEPLPPREAARHADAVVKLAER